MRVRDLMTATPITVDPETPMLEAGQRMVGKQYPSPCRGRDGSRGGHRHRPRHPAQPALAGHEPLGVGDQLSAAAAHRAAVS